MVPATSPDKLLVQTGACNSFSCSKITEKLLTEFYSCCANQIVSHIHTSLYVYNVIQAPVYGTQSSLASSQWNRFRPVA